jgi:cytochrome c oxidase subunit II
MRIVKKIYTALLIMFFLFSAGAVFAQSPIEIVARKSHYTPETIHVKKGEKVRLVVRSEDVTHGFAIDEFGIAREIPLGPPVVIEFTPDRAGSFSYYCVVRCGREHKQMRGTLIVE